MTMTRAISERVRDDFQRDYDNAVKAGNAPAGYGNVTAAFGVVGRYGGAMLVIEFEDGRRLSPYFNQSAFDGDIEYQDGMTDGQQIEDDPTEWADNMSGATDWSDWQWETVEPGTAF